MPHKLHWATGSPACNLLPGSQAYCTAGRWRETEPVLQVSGRWPGFPCVRSFKPALRGCMSHSPPYHSAAALPAREPMPLRMPEPASACLPLFMPQEMRDRGVPPTEHIFRSLIWCTGRHHRAGAPRARA